MDGTVASGSPQHWKIWTKSLSNLPSKPAAFVEKVGGPPVQANEIAWFTRSCVWLMVNCIEEKMPRPDTVTCDGVEGSEMSVPAVPP